MLLLEKSVMSILFDAHDEMGSKEKNKQSEQQEQQPNKLANTKDNDRKKTTNMEKYKDNDLEKMIKIGGVDTT